MPNQKPIFYDGVPYPTKKALAAAYGISEKTCTKRLAEGVPLDQATSRVIFYDGTPYPSYKALAKAFDLSVSGVHQRLRDGIPLDAPKHRARPERIVFRGTPYRSKRALAKAYDVNPSTFIERLNRDWTLEQALGVDPPPTTVWFDGMPYANYKELADAHNVDINTFHGRRQNGKSVREALGLVEPENAIVYDGVPYPNPSALAHAYNVCPKRLAYRLKANWTMEEALELTPRRKPKTVQRNKRPPIFFDNRFFKSKAKLVAFYGLNASSVYLAEKAGKSLDDIVFGEDRCYADLSFDGVVYHHPGELARAYGVNPTTFRRRLDDGFTIDEALEELGATHPAEAACPTT